MLNYTDQLYAKFGRKFVPTGRTGADWDRMEKALRDLIAASQSYMSKNKLQPAGVYEGLVFPDTWVCKTMPIDEDLTRIKNAMDNARKALVTEAAK